MKAIILAGGKGTRLVPITNSIPKALVPFGNSTLIETILDNLPDTVDTVVITTKYLGNMLREKIGSSYKGKKIQYAEQPKDRDGTWEALYCAKQYINEEEVFCVLNCDDLFKKEELTEVMRSKKIGMGVTKTTMPAKYHGIITNTDGIVEGFKRHTDMDKEEIISGLFANGFFMLDDRVFSFPPVALSDNEHGLPQTLLAHKETYPLVALPLAHWQPCNSIEDLEKLK
jgi:UDP-N-acetylglucosamine diphosphorylase / glucose-1-phosphate thymidylyltransferase / UDP-N-acetylgalactosamine diphosphorylase / glucosamine-1-phosphate N-acetyltransferase / galactosamine-1-phosphate N-acetyltransferase